MTIALNSSSWWPYLAKSLTYLMAYLNQGALSFKKMVNIEANWATPSQYGSYHWETFFLFNKDSRHSFLSKYDHHVLVLLVWLFGATTTSWFIQFYVWQTIFVLLGALLMKPWSLLWCQVRAPDSSYLQRTSNWSLVFDIPMFWIVAL